MSEPAPWSAELALRHLSGLRCMGCGAPATVIIEPVPAAAGTLERSERGYCWRCWVRVEGGPRAEPAA